MQCLITRRYIWPRMNSDARRWPRNCLQCQRAKVHWHTVVLLSTFFIPDACFDQIHIDIVGPFPPSNRYTYLLTCADRFMHWPEAISLTSITAEAVTHAFISGWISRFSIPSTVTADRGRQFKSDVMCQLFLLMGSKCCRTTAYHSYANGLVEHFLL